MAFVGSIQHKLHDTSGELLARLKEIDSVNPACEYIGNSSRWVHTVESFRSQQIGGCVLTVFRVIQKCKTGVLNFLEFYQNFFFFILEARFVILCQTVK